MARKALTLKGVIRTQGKKAGMAVFASPDQAKDASLHLAQQAKAQGQEAPEIEVLEGFVSSRALAAGMATRFTVTSELDPFTTYLADVTRMYLQPGSSN